MKTDRPEDEGDNDAFSNFTEILVYRKVPNISDCYYYMGIDRREKNLPWVCEQQRRRPACVSAQSDQHVLFVY